MITVSELRYSYHVEGQQYLFMNLLGAENRFHLLSSDLDRNGRQSSPLAPRSGRPIPLDN